MPEIGTSGLMSGERKRSVAAWPKLPRLSSTLLRSSGLRALRLGEQLSRPSLRAKRSNPGCRTVNVMRREGGASSTPWLIDLITAVSGILDHPPQCAIAHKAGDDDRI